MGTASALVEIRSYLTASERSEPIKLFYPAVNLPGEISDASEPSRRAIFWRKGARWIRNDIGGLLVVFIPI